MNAVDMARMAYGSGSAPIRTQRGTEYAVFADVTRRLQSACSAGPDDFAALASAVHANRRLWIILAADLADTDNGLPSELRARLFYLARFVDHHSRQVLRREMGAEPLVDINRSVMRGLAPQGKAA
ncbi:flagellar biosynthesis regulator FlaF [Roseicyclus sp. F158]|uniref:Flagellar biosynthesis regulator FlaF n=1 Tax=Tropicimonas omnivorans TaxID=3075590 RepID=A0ABU3DDA7_9RHOB|nr:flagellar biosynthesis regulator FlaF [Roseicyclus sp. F158]MDT0681697.1 flagellar biosynthesis regulator FlaF [Roseicyclus sp. F158]